MNFKKVLGPSSLLLAALIWGFAFVAQTSGAANIPTFTFNFLRSYIALFFLGILVAVISRKNPEILPKTKKEKKDLVSGGMLCGLALFIATSFQQYGISVYPVGAGASGRAGFITALYVVLVPCFSAVLFRKRTHPLVWGGVIVAVAGMYLLCFGGGISRVYMGDALVLICAFFFCLQILSIDRAVAKSNGILLSLIQFFTMGTLSLICMVIFERPDWSAVGSSIGSILYLGIMSSGVAYTLQIIGQRYTEPTLASILMSLESVFAVIGGWMLLGERLLARELVGCALVFLAIIIAQLPGFIKKK